jgi:hypothetical protein
MIVSVIVNDPPFYFDTLPLIFIAAGLLLALTIKEIIGIFKRRKARREAQK